MEKIEMGAEQVHVSRNNDGWTGEKCLRCKGTGEIDTEHSYAACPDCGGTGELYVAELDQRYD